MIISFDFTIDLIKLLLPTFDVEFQNAKQFITLQENPKQCASTNESLQ